MISSFTRNVKLCLVALAFAGFMTLGQSTQSPAAAQESDQQQGQKAGAGADANKAARAWRKQCGGQNKDQCFVEQMVVVNKRVVMVGSFGYKSPTEPVAVITVPLNTLLKAGLALKIDDKKQVSVPYDLCGRQGCRVEYPLSVDMISDLRSGKALNVGWRSADGKNQTLRFGLTGFAAAWDDIAKK